MDDSRCTRISYDGRDASCREEINRKKQLEKSQEKSRGHRCFYIRFDTYTEKEYVELIEALKNLPFDINVPTE